MSIYSDQLDRTERRALKKHTNHDLADEIDLLRIMIKRELGGQPDIEAICKATETIIKAELARHRLQTKPDDQLRLAFQAALNALDAEDASPLLQSGEG